MSFDRLLVFDSSLRRLKKVAADVRLRALTHLVVPLHLPRLRTKVVLHLVDRSHLSASLLRELAMRSSRY